MFDFFHRRGGKIALTAIVLGCMAARIWVALRFTRPNHSSTRVCAIVLSVVAGVLWIGVIVLTRPRDFKSVRNVAVSGIVGALLGVIVLSHPILSGSYGYDHGFGETEKSVFWAAIIGTGLALAAYFGVQSIVRLSPASPQTATFEGARHPNPSYPAMRQFFKPLRRKVGLATLMLACFFTVVWVRMLCGEVDFTIELGRGRTVTFVPDYDVHERLAIGLTLLSAVLLLSKPRPAKKSEPPLPPEPDHA